MMSPALRAVAGTRVAAAAEDVGSSVPRRRGRTQYLFAVATVQCSRRRAWNSWQRQAPDRVGFRRAGFNV